jgi:hypothetical protein
VGARVYAHTGDSTQMREVRAGNNFVSQDPAHCHFGLGSHASAGITIVWPNGHVETRADVPAGTELVISAPPAETQCARAAPRWVVHLTASGGGFETLVYAANLGDSHAIADLQTYASDGSFLGNTTVELPAGAHVTWPAEVLFGERPVSHFALFAPDAVSLTAGYRLAGVESGIAHVHHNREAATSHLFYPGNPRVVFDGMALVNPNDVPVTVTAELIAPDGAPGQSIVLESELAPRAKLLTVFDDLFPGEDKRLIAVRSDLPTRVLFLRGTRPGTEPGLLFPVQPLPVQQTSAADTNPQAKVPYR